MQITRGLRVLFLVNDLYALLPRWGLTDLIPMAGSGWELFLVEDEAGGEVSESFMFTVAA